MDSTDDDFGELYVDVKVPASALVSGDGGFVKSCEEAISDQNRAFEGTLNPEWQGEMKKFDVVAAKDSSPCVDACAVNLNEESEYSESDDDLNIVLEEDDSKKLACLSNPNNGCYVEPSRTCSFKKQKRRIGNWCTMPNAGMVNGYMKMDTSVNTWSRATFDVNSDVFEKKPWRNPGMDINDFFNFGFNEQSWKDYCLPLLKGSAIEVGGETLERIPSADLHRPRDSDPDVVIQVPVTNDFEELSSVEARSRSVTSIEASRSGDSIKENTGSSSGEQSPSKENHWRREVTPCDEEMVGEEKEDIRGNSDESDTYSAERESSLGDRIRFSPTPSCSSGKSEEFENSETESSKGSDSDVQREVINPPRRTRFTDHEATNIKSEERSGTKHSRRRRSQEDPSERHFRRIDYVGHRRTKHGIVRGNGFPHSYREKSHGRFYSSVVHDRHRGHRFGWNKSSRGWGLDHCNGYKHEVRLREYTSHSSFNLNQRNSRSSFEEDEDRYGRQHCERKYTHERRSHVLPNERNRYDWLREPFDDQDYRYRLEYSFAHGRHNPKQSHENDLHCRRRGDYEYDFHRHREESGIPSELAYREMHSFPEVGRREFQGYERNEEFSEIDRRYHDGFVSEKDGYKYRVQDRWPSPSLPMRDSWYTKGSRGDSWRDDTRDFTPSEAYKAGPRDGWTRKLVHNDNVSLQDRLTYDDDEWVRRDRRRYESADDIPCSMREVVYSEHPSYTDEIFLARDMRMPTRNRMSAKQRSGYLKSNVREGHHISKKLRRDGHERQDPINLTGRQGKLSNKSKRRFSNGGDAIEQEEGEKPGKVLCRSIDKATQIQDMNDKEEGEIIEAAKNLKEIAMDEARMLASMKMMEKRRERFKETQVARPVVAIESQTKPEAKTDYTDQQRPVRKRRWCESLGVFLNQ